MDSRYGLMVAVAVVFAGVFTFYFGRHSTMVAMCREFQSLTEQTRAATSESIDERTGTLMTLTYIQKKHCS
jgi:hypothetical protein